MNTKDRVQPKNTTKRSAVQAQQRASGARGSVPKGKVRCFTGCDADVLEQEIMWFQRLSLKLFNPKARELASEIGVALSRVSALNLDLEQMLTGTPDGAGLVWEDTPESMTRSLAVLVSHALRTLPGSIAGRKPLLQALASTLPEQHESRPAVLSALALLDASESIESKLANLTSAA